MKELSTEIIEIGGIEYTLFLNRKGIVIFERASKLLKTAKELFKTSDDNDVDVLGDIDPFKYYEDKESEEEKQIEIIRNIIKKFYWIALYTNYKFNEQKVSELIDQAEKEYGLEQLIQLSNKMIEEVNNNPENVQAIKKLKALQPKNEDTI